MGCGCGQQEGNVLLFKENSSLRRNFRLQSEVWFTCFIKHKTNILFVGGKLRLCCMLEFLRLAIILSAVGM